MAVGLFEEVPVIAAMEGSMDIPTQIKGTPYAADNMINSPRAETHFGGWGNEGSFLARYPHPREKKAIMTKKPNID